MENEITIDRSRYDEANEDRSILKTEAGNLTEETILKIAEDKGEPEWVTEKRLKSLKLYHNTSFPNWGPSLEKLRLDKINFYVKPDAKKNSKSWDDVPEDIKRTFEKIGIPEAERRSLAGVGAQYDCLTEDAIVFTNPRGGVKIKDIKPKDYVFALDESTNKIVRAKVKGFMDKGVRPVFEVKVRGKSIKATYNHPFLTLVDRRKPGRKRARYSKEWKYLHELKKNDIICIATNLPDFGKPYNFSKIKYKQKTVGRNQFGVTYELDISHCYKDVKFPTESNNDLMWLFGFYLGDGYITQQKGRDKRRLHFAIHESQPELKEKVEEVMKKYFGYNVTTEDKFRISINSTKIALFFKKNGFFGNAKTKDLPQWAFSIPKEQKMSLIAGYIDSDGTVREKSKDAVITSINYSLLGKIKELCFYCGLDTSKITTFNGSKYSNGGHRLQITGKTKYLPCVHSIKKKRLLSRVSGFGKHNSLRGTTIRKYCSDSVGFSRIDDIKYIGKEKVYDIEVEGHHNFVANGIIAHNSSVVYHSLQKDLEKQGVIFCDMDVAVKEHPELIKKYFMSKCIPINDHKFIMLHGAVWSGGTFIYVPKGVKVRTPLQAYFRMNAERGGQFEHTLIIADEGSEVNYVEGCSAPQYGESVLHAGCVELFVHKNARIRYSSVENWSRNTFNLNTKRAIVEESGIVEWINGNLGSGVTMLYPCSVLVGENARSTSLGIAFAGEEQHQDTGSKVIHAAPNTKSVIKSKSISKDGGISTYRGLVHITKQAKNSSCSVICDALLMDEKSKSNTYPTMKIENKEVDMAHEATVGKISQETITYLRSRGLSEEQAVQMVALGYIEEVVKALPLEYAVELNKLIALEMEGSVG